MSSSDDAKPLHRIIRFIAGLAVESFFTEVRVIGGESVPTNGPIIVTATHHNMMLDPVILSVGFPYKRMLNYWSKASLFANPVAAWILYSSGNIPVDRKSKDRQKLFKGTIQALSKGGAVALFPEGTSYTEPRIMQVKDGAAWAAMEYTKWASENSQKAAAKDATIVPVSIVYTNKSKYRSAVIMEFGRPISLDPYKEQFFSTEEGAPRAAVKRLTRRIEQELVENTVNAPDWDTLFAARMARDILWEKDGSIRLDDFVVVSQTLVDLFTEINVTSNCKTARRHLLEYYSLLQSSHLTNSVLSSLPLPRSLDPKHSATIPSRLYTLLILIRDSIPVFIQLPFILIPLLIHAPVYFMGRVGAKLADTEEETQAQNKVALGLLSLLLIYPSIFFFLWSTLWYTRVGALVAASVVSLFAVYHVRMIDRSYERAKQFIAAWRVLVGVWVPRRWDLSLPALSQYMKPKIPPPNPWIDRPLNNTEKAEAEGDVKAPASSTESKAHDALAAKGRSRRPPSRRLVRHVLRARVEATNGLAALFDSLAHHGRDKKVKASAHLAKAHGGGVVKAEAGSAEASVGEGEEGWRYAAEIVAFLKKRGAVIPTLGQGPMEDDWALSSENEGYTTGEDGEEPVWVSRTH
ncbi:glycerol-3-phosphate-acyltransferase [Crepidotus variabilis]|uniref:Glycerol-3-phosphate-acyltransferase n=1 Tax=Crepidotus variabilis TaxID=179855 RepID=A0A9P6JS57_9AGAR|nr:glycerol-3-phosphate-acyltransferase [Crepidotus variabilis]